MRTSSVPLRGIFVGLLVLASVASADVPYWNWRNPLPQGVDFFAVTHGEGRFVAVGRAGAVVTSTDGVNWEQAYSDTRGSIVDMAYGNGRFVAVGFDLAGTMISDDGVVWRHIPAAGPTQAEWGKVTSVTWAAGRFWGMSNRLNFVATSEDGVTWSKHAGASALNVGRITEGGGVLLGIDTMTSSLGSSGGGVWDYQTVRSVVSTDDGATWQYAADLTGLATVSGGPVYLNGRWLVAGTEVMVDNGVTGFNRTVLISDDNGGSWLWGSSDGSIWSGNAPLYDLEVYQDRAYILGIAGKLIMSTPDGHYPRVDWADSSGPPLQVNDLAAGPDRLVGVGRYGLLVSSADGQTWTRHNRSVTGGNLRAAAWGDGRWLVAGDTGLLTSSDGQNWSRLAGTEEFTGGAVAYGAGRFVASGSARRIVVSTDGGLTWTHDAGTEASLTRVVFGNDRFVGLLTPAAASGNPAGIHVSTDGLTWTAAMGLEAYGVRRIEFIEGLFYLVGSLRADDSGVILRSADGLSWTLVGTAPAEVMAIAGFKDRMVAATIEGGVLVSSFGAGWQPVGNRPLAPHGPPASFEAVGDQFVGVTYYGHVVVSSDGETWAAEDFSGEGMVFELEQGNGQLLALGNGGLIWESATARFTNNSARSHVGTADSLLISGFVVSGNEPQRMLLRAAGPALADAGIAGALQHPVLQLFGAGGTILSYNAGWSTHETAAEVATASAQVGAFAFAPDSADSAMVWDLPPGAYTAMVSGQDGETGVALVEIYAIAGEASHLVNISTRTHVGTGENLLITGFVVGGDAAKQILVRGVGPTLERFQVEGVLARPQLRVLRGEEVLASNTGWGNADNADEIREVSARVGAFALDEGSADSALLLTLAPGVYTVHVAGADGGTGVAIAEVYEVR